MTVQDMRRYYESHSSTSAASHSECKHYAQGVYKWAQRESNAIPSGFEYLGCRKKHTTSTKAPKPPSPVVSLSEKELERRRNHCLAALFDDVKALRADQAVALAAVRQDGLQLEHASAAIKANAVVVREAVITLAPR